MPTNRKRQADLMRKLRKERQVSQADLAEMMKIAAGHQWHATTVSRIERGEQLLKDHEVESLKALLGYPELFDALEASGDQAEPVRALDLIDDLQRQLEAFETAMVGLEIARRRLDTVTATLRALRFELETSTEAGVSEKTRQEVIARLRAAGND